MKIIFAHDHRFLTDGAYFYSKSGLPQAVLERYASVFGKVVVVCRSDAHLNVALEPIKHPDIEFEPQVNVRSIKGLRHWAGVKSNIRELVAGADGVVARLPSTLGLIAAKQARLMGKPCLIEVVGNGLEAGMMHGNPLGKIFSPVTHHITCREIAHADRVVYITKKYLQEIYPSNGTIFTCSNVKVDPITDRQLEERIARFVKKTSFVVGLIGSLDVNYKGHDVALKVIKKMTDAGFNNVEIEFVGAGDPVRWENLSKQLGISNRVKFKGALPPGQKVMDWIDRVDVMLQPSKTEGQGRSIIESMSRGCPVISSNVGGIPELLSADMICDPLDVEGLATRCIKLLSSKDNYGSVASSNLRASLEFSEDIVEGQRRQIFKAFRDSLANGEL